MTFSLLFIDLHSPRSKSIANMFGRSKATSAEIDSGSDVQRSGSDQYVQNVDPLAETSKTRWERLWPVMACGAGLFSDGYINNVKSTSAQKRLPLC